MEINEYEQDPRNHTIRIVYSL